MRKEKTLSALAGAVLGAASLGFVYAPAETPTITTRPSVSVVANGAWTVYHRDNAHTGFDSTQPTAAGATTGWVSATLDQQVYAQPLVYNGVVYVATLNNTVYALNQADGTTLWSKNLGAPTTSGWVCGNVSPMGILGTPVVDPSANRIYVAALLSTHVYWVFGLDLANNGNIVLQTSLPGDPNLLPWFDWKIQQERGALAVANGYVYVPFGGRAGDCNDGSILFQGWIFGVPTSGTGAVKEWNTGGSGGSSMWAPGGVVVDDSTGRVFITTGNGNCPSTYDNYNDAIVRLSPTLTLEDYFAPSDWRNHWSCNDEDLGSSSTILINPNLAFQSGKWGAGFLVNPQSLGGIDGQLFPTPKPQIYQEMNVCRGDTSAANYGSYAYAAPYVYLSCEQNGIVGLKVDTAAKTFSRCDASCPSPSWNAGGGIGKVYGAPVVAGGVVWAVDTNDSGLTGFDAVSGSVVYQSAAFGAQRFSSPTIAGGQIFVSSNNVIRQFNIVKACTNATLSAAPPSPQVAGTAVTLTAGVTNCPSPLFKFWVRPPGGSWGVVQSYGASNTYNWTSTNTPGVYGLEVDIKNTGSAAAYDSVANITFTITSASACTNAGLALSPPSPGGTGVAVTLTGSSSTCPNPRYRFWVRDPGSRWSMVRDYAAGNTYLWTQTGRAGTYSLEVDVRDASESVVYDVVANATYAATPCTGAGLNANPASPQAHGTAITLTGSATCLGTPTYRFWVRAPGGAWQITRDYSTSSTFVWTPAAAGIYSLEVDVRNQNATAVYEAVANTTFQAT